MYNFNAETWVITYPHGAGGRLLELILSLDSDMCGLDKNTQKSNLFESYRDYLLCNNNAHYYNHHTLDPLEQDFSKSIRCRNKYVFSFHMEMFLPYKNFFKCCQNLKIINITLCGSDDATLLNTRRKQIRANQISVHDLALHQPDRLELWQHHYQVQPVLDVNLHNYWNPNKFIPDFQHLIETQGLDIKFEEWVNLYLIWHNRTVRLLG